MINISRLTKRISYITASTVIAVGSLLALVPQSASASTVTTRSIEMSSSSNAASNATTTYLVNFTVPAASTQTTLRGVVIDFCSNSPIIGDTTCGAAAGAVPTLSTTGLVTGGVLTASGWTAALANSNRTLILSQAAGVAVTAGSSVVTITINNVQNPTALGTFYARIYTYTAQAGATGYTVANPDVGGVHSDDGGVALSTANQLTVTAKVQETLLFCIYTTGTQCSGSSIAGIPLGDSFGVLSVYNSAYIAATLAKVGIASNATSGVIVRAKGATLTSGGNTIAATGAVPGNGVCEADSVTTTREQFGFRVSAVGANQSAASGTYGCGAGLHAFNTTNLGSTYGDEIVRTAGAQDESASSLEFAAKAATTTKPGVYTSTMTFIATGTY